jgi:hypothetical protein
MVSLEELAELWAANLMAEKRASGILTEIIARQEPATNPNYGGGNSVFTKLITPNGHHIGTVHEIVMADGSIPHSHPKDYTKRDCSRVRGPERTERVADRAAASDERRP